jgi:hypothetical protein
MAEGNWSVILVEKISAEGAQKTEHTMSARTKATQISMWTPRELPAMFTSRTRAV